ncbi:MAG: LptF/LptG family permease [Campylobacterales bacterium]|nr:LptF/LptG family permease [Campylobacterales bacterium]
MPFRLYFIYLARLYFKNAFVMLMGLSGAFAMINYLQNTGLLQSGFNNQLLYTYYRWQETLEMIYPITLVFAAILTKIYLIKSNALGAMYSFGYTKKQIIAPFLVVAFGIHLLFVYLNTTSFAYANDNAESLHKGRSENYTKTNLFFKYNDAFVYLKRLDPIAKKIYELDIFNIEDGRLISTVSAKSASFNGELWEAKDILIKKQIYKEGQLQRFEIQKQEQLDTLKGYKPLIIDQIYEGKNINLIDAYNGLILLNEQGLDSYKMRSAIYMKLVFPLFALCLIVVVFFKVPAYARFMNLAITLAITLGTVFLIWGILFAFNQIGASGTLMPEIATLLPVVLLGLYTLNIYRKIDKRI